MANRQIKDLTARGSIGAADLFPVQAAADAEAGANSIQDLQDYLDTLYAATGHTHDFGSLTNKPTTLAGYGITDGGGSTYKEYRSMIYQSGTTAPIEASSWVDTITHHSSSPGTDPLFRVIGFTRTGVGDYTLKISSNEAGPLATYRTEVGFSDGKIRLGTHYTTSQSPFSFSEFVFSSYAPDGTKSDDIISFTNIYIRVYP